MDLVANLFALVAVKNIVAPGDGAIDDVRKVAMQLHSRVLRACEAAAAENTNGHLKIAAKLLAHYIRCNLGSAKDGMQAVINRHALVYADPAIGIVVAFIQ